MGVVTINIAIPAELKNLVGDAADSDNKTMNEFIAATLAEKVQRVDLGVIPRKKPGRPRKVV